MIEPQARLAFLSIFLRHIKLNWINKYLIVNSALFLIISISITYILLKDKNLDIETAYSLAIIFLLLSFMLGNYHLLEYDYKNGFITQLLLAGIMLEVILSAKLTANYLISLIISLLIVPAVIFLFVNDIKWSIVNTLSFMANIALITAILNTLITFSNSLLLGYASNNIAAIIILPLALPSLVFSTLAISNPYYLLLMLTILLITIPIKIYLSSILIKTALIES